jgi:hypothetical protein
MKKIEANGGKGNRKRKHNVKKLKNKNQDGHYTK